MRRYVGQQGEPVFFWLWPVERAKSYALENLKLWMFKNPV